MRRPIKQKQTFTLAIAFTAVVIVCSQFFAFHAHAFNKKEVKTEQQDEESEDVVYISQPSTSLPTSTHVELNQTLIFLFEILFEIEGSEKRDFDVLLPTNLFFRTLFDGVISPNAP